MSDSLPRLKNFVILIFQVLNFNLMPFSHVYIITPFLSAILVSSKVGQQSKAQRLCCSDLSSHEFHFRPSSHGYFNTPCLHYFIGFFSRTTRPCHCPIRQQQKHTTPISFTSTRTHNNLSASSLFVKCHNLPCLTQYLPKKI